MIGSRRYDSRGGIVATVLTIVCAALVPADAAGQTNERIYEDLDFRFVTPGARAVGMGKTFVGLADDATAESWLARAWSQFAGAGDVHGQCLTAARAVFSKTDSWRTHEGLAVWTRRLLELLEAGDGEAAEEHWRAHMQVVGRVMLGQEASTVVDLLHHL